MSDARLEIRNDVFQPRNLRRQARSSFLRGPVFLGLMLRAIQVVTNGFQFLQRDIDDAILSVRKEQ